MEKATIIIPTYNESENIPNLIEKLNVLNERIRHECELKIIFVDDNSPDKTVDAIEEERANATFDIQVIKREGKLGLGTAYIRGFQEAIGQGAKYIIQMDADLSHDPITIQRMLEELQLNDFVIGSRYIRGGQLPPWSPLRKLISKGGNLYSRIVLGFDIHDYTGGFNAYNRKVLESIDLDKITSNGYSFQIEMKYRSKQNNYCFKEVPIHFHDRTKGQSKFSSKIFFEAMFNTLKLRLNSSK